MAIPIINVTRIEYFMVVLPDKAGTRLLFADRVERATCPNDGDTLNFN
jgi:hypothetical protein